MKMISILFLLFSLISSNAWAHKNSDSYLNINQKDDKVAIQWEIALKDLNRLLNIDTDKNGSLTWQEVKQKHNEIAVTALNALQIKNGDELCSYGSSQHLISKHGGAAYAVLKTEATCASPIQNLTVNYNFLFDQNSQHRGIMAVKTGEKTYSFVFSPKEASFTTQSSAVVNKGFVTFFIKGVEHLLGGIDHLLFLFVLLLPATMGTIQREQNSLSHTLVETFKILTAFTVAHAITLTLSVLKLVSFPVTPVEIVIAISVAIAAADNIWPFIGRYRWAIAGGFGLIHGLGFAFALGPLDLSSEALFVALLAFNLGLEAAQILIAALLIPLGYFLFHQRKGLAAIGSNLGSATAIMIALLWTIDRSFGLEMMPF